MSDCKRCIMYSEAYDELRATYNDIAKGEIRHSCMLFEEGIDPQIFAGKKKCDSYIEEQK